MRVEANPRLSFFQFQLNKCSLQVNQLIKCVNLLKTCQYKTILINKTTETPIVKK